MSIEAGRPPRSRPSAARERILATADRLFYDEGIRAVGIERVVAESGVTRVTLYRHFPSKDDLVAAYLEARAERDRTRITAAVGAHHGDPRAALHEIAADTLAHCYRGCPFVNAAAEHAATHRTRTIAAAHRTWIAEFTERLLRELGHPRPARTARLLLMLRTGAVVAGSLEGGPVERAYLAGWDALIDA
jgi:AcrR family transcriptional regulator